MLQFRSPNSGSVPRWVMNGQSGLGVDQGYKWIIEKKRNEQETDQRLPARNHGRLRNSFASNAHQHS